MFTVFVFWWYEKFWLDLMEEMMLPPPLTQLKIENSRLPR
jgi:hypothetical protein